MRVLSIDPGSKQSAYLLYDTETRAPVRLAVWGEPGTLWGSISENAIVERQTQLHHGSKEVDHLAIEYMQARGMPTSNDELDAQFEAGRFVQAWGGAYTKVYRKDVKMHICGSMRAKDSNIRQALIDRYGGKEKAIGNKKNPGPLYGIKRDLWSALAIAITWAETANHET